MDDVFTNLGTPDTGALICYVWFLSLRLSRPSLRLALMLRLVRAIPLNVEQISGDTYDPVEVTANAGAYPLVGHWGAPLPASCALQPVIVSADLDTGDPLATVFRNPDSLLNLTGSYPGNTDANLVLFTVRLTVNARQRLVAGEDIELNIVGPRSRPVSSGVRRLQLADPRCAWDLPDTPVPS